MTADEAMHHSAQCAGAGIAAALTATFWPDAWPVFGKVVVAVCGALAGILCIAWVALASAIEARQRRNRATGSGPKGESAIPNGETHNG